MDRRDFLQSVTVVGAAVAVPGGAVAGVAATGDATTLVLAQDGVRGAESLAAAIVAAFERAGVADVRVMHVDGDDLTSVPQLAALACGQTGRRIVGIMDDAVATIFLSVAGDCGAGYRLEASHRIGAESVRHALRPVGLEDDLAWSERGVNWEHQVADLYAAIVAGRALSIDMQRIVSGRPSPDGDSLVSFVLNT